MISVNDKKTTRKGEIRLAEIEYGKNTELCRSLGVKKVPSIFFYYNGKKLDGFPCGPKRIAHTLDRLNYYRSLSPSELAFEATMGQGNTLGDTLLREALSDEKDTGNNLENTASTHQTVQSHASDDH